jgi:hypothetical protein
MRKQHMVQPNRTTKNPALIIDTDYYRNEYGNSMERPKDIGKTLREIKAEKETGENEAVKDDPNLLKWIQKTQKNNLKKKEYNNEYY